MGGKAGAGARGGGVARVRRMMSTLSITYLRQSSDVDGLKTRPDLQPAWRTSESERSMCVVASGWKVMKSAPASAKSAIMPSTGVTIRCTSIGCLMPYDLSALQTIGPIVRFGT